MSRANPRRVSSGHSELCYPLMTGNHGGKFVAAKTPVYLQYPSTIITAAIGCCDFNSIRVCTWMLIVWLYLSSLGAQSLHAQSGSNGVHGFGSTRSAAYQCVNTATGRIIPYCYMRFSAPVGIRTTGGHFHEVNRPSGKVATSRNGSFRDTVTIQANALGIATVWYKKEPLDKPKNLKFAALYAITMYTVLACRISIAFIRVQSGFLLVDLRRVMAVSRTITL